jgi:BirA family biotin operon repressor/biotin-[acetyl-CoA-carboxylase] ligase
MPPRFSPAAFRAALSALGDHAEREVVVHRETASTSTDLKRRLSNGALPGTVIAADRQTAGRGRRGRDWHSAGVGNLYISVALEIQGPARETVPMLPLAAGIAASDAIRESTRITPLLKWPNDILVKGRKLAGILTESFRLEKHRFVAVVGLGVNVAATAFPSALSDLATSLVLESGDAPALESLAARWVKGLEDWRPVIEGGKRHRVTAAWKSRAEPFGRRVRVGDIEGRTVDLLDDGRLMLLTPENERVALAGGIVEPMG